MDIRREMERLTDRAVCVPDTELPEVRWLKEQYQIFIHVNSVRSKKDADALLIGLLQLFDRTWIRRNGSDHTRQIQEALRIPDKLLARQGQRHMRFMLFKALETL